LIGFALENLANKKSQNLHKPQNVIFYPEIISVAGVDG
jgi:hypothetical protein